MHFVYLLQSKLFPKQRYTGLTCDVASRLVAHNNGQSSHTSKFRPWELVSFFGFTDQNKAVAFEKYLKSGSGRAFAAKHFWSADL